jgi:hypothetical protein
VNVALLGGTGRVGRAVLARALAAGHAVQALVRPGAGLPAMERLAVREGLRPAGSNIRGRGAQALLDPARRDAEQDLLDHSLIHGVGPLKLAHQRQLDLGPLVGAADARTRQHHLPAVGGERRRRRTPVAAPAPLDVGPLPRPDHALGVGLHQPDHGRQPEIGHPVAQQLLRRDHPGQHRQQYLPQLVGREQRRVQSLGPGQSNDRLLLRGSLCSLLHRRLLVPLGDGVLNKPHLRAGQGAARRPDTQQGARVCALHRHREVAADGTSACRRPSSTRAHGSSNYNRLRGLAHPAFSGPKPTASGAATPDQTSCTSPAAVADMSKQWAAARHDQLSRVIT